MDGEQNGAQETQQQGESDRVDFALQLAGCRSVKAARAVLEDHGGDIDALKAAESWLFAAHAAPDTSGKTGLPNVGAAEDMLEVVPRDLGGRARKPPVLHLPE